jgi:hypothetical protein
VKKAIYIILGVLFLSALLVTLTLDFSTEPAVAAEKMSATAGNVNVLLDNDRVRVVEATRHPETKVPMHTHPTYLAYFFRS